MQPIKPRKAADPIPETKISPTPMAAVVTAQAPQCPAPILTASYSITLAEAEAKARKIVNKWAVGAAAVGWIPGSMIALAAGDVALCSKVAACFHVTEWSKESVAAALGASVTGKVVAGEALSFVPIIGWAVKSAVASGVTKAVGEGIIAYFRKQSPLL